MADHEQLRDLAAAVVGDDVHGLDRKFVEQRHQHRDLRIGGDALPIGDFGMTQRHEVGGDAATIRRQAFERAAPLETVEREAVQEQRGIAGAAFDVGDPAEVGLHEPSRSVEGRRVQRPASARHQRRCGCVRRVGQTGERAGRDCAGRHCEKGPAMHVSSPGLDHWVAVMIGAPGTAGNDLRDHGFMTSQVMVLAESGPYPAGSNSIDSRPPQCPCPKPM
jgi:hypothetical protein